MKIQIKLLLITAIILSSSITSLSQTIKKTPTQNVEDVVIFMSNPSSQLLEIGWNDGFDADGYLVKCYTTPIIPPVDGIVEIDNKYHLMNVPVGIQYCAIQGIPYTPNSYIAIYPYNNNGKDRVYKKDVKIFTFNYTKIATGTTIATSFNCLDAINCKPSTQSTDYKWVYGYIISSDKNGLLIFPPVFDLQTIILADSVNETNQIKTFIIGTSNDIYESLRLTVNPSNKYKRIAIYGKIVDYFGRKGIKDIQEYKWLNEKVLSDKTINETLPYSAKMDWEISKNGKITIPKNQTFIIQNMTLESNDTEGSIIHNEGILYISGALKMKRSINSGTWQFICLPFDVDPKTGITDESGKIPVRYKNWNICYYDAQQRANETNTIWVDVPITEKLVAGHGYIINTQKNETYTFNALQKTKNKAFVARESQIKLTHKTKESTLQKPINNGWNLIGNPFSTSYLANNNFGKIIYLYNSVNDNYSVFDCSATGSDEISLKPWQSYFIQSNNPTDTILSYSPTQRVQKINRYINNNNNNNNVNNRFLLEISNGEFKDVCSIVFDNSCDIEYKINEDAAKLFGKASLAEIYTETQTGIYSINKLPYPESSQTINLKIFIRKPGNYSLILKEYIPEYDDVILITNENGTTELAKEQFNIVADKPEIKQYKLQINKNITTTINNSFNAKPMIKQSNQNLHIEVHNEKFKISLFSFQGIELYSKEFVDHCDIKMESGERNMIIRICCKEKVHISKISL